MKRESPRRNGLRQTGGLERSRLSSTSSKRRKTYRRRGGRIEFRAAFLVLYPHCMVRWGGCRAVAQDVHEIIARGIGGSILPDEKAVRQKQRFAAVCRHCHDELDRQTGRARAEGWKAGVGDIERMVFYRAGGEAVPWPVGVPAHLIAQALVAPPFRPLA